MHTVANETELMNEIRATLNRMPGVRLFRNNCGTAFRQGGGAIVYGLAIGSGDLIGLVRGRFVSLEIKTAHGRVTDDQLRWRDTINALGGVAAIVRSVKQAVEVVEGILHDQT